MRKTALRKIVVNASVQNAFGLEKTQCSNSGLYKEEPLASMVSDTARCKLLENASVQNHGGLKGKNLGNFANSGRQTVKLKLIQSKIKTVLRSN